MVVDNHLQELISKNMFPGAKLKKLSRIYKEFNKEARKYMHLVTCKPGCADCCTDVGNIDTTTLEGLAIVEHIATFLPSKQKDIYRQIRKNSEKKAYYRRLKCPFLQKNNTCAIYAVRPFSCRRLFSVRTCGETGPVIPRGLWVIGENTLHKIYRLDEDGVSGHISYILILLNNTTFRNLYILRKLTQDKIKEFTETYDLIINRSMVKKQNISGMINSSFPSNTPKA